MKKIALITTILLITGVMCFAQSLEVYETVGGQDVKRTNGEVLIKDFSGKKITFALKVKNVKATNLSVYCKKVYIQILQGSINTFCWDRCYTSKIFVSTDPVVIQPQEIVTRFDATYGSYDYSGESRIRYVWFDGANPADSIGVEVKFISHSTGVDENRYTSIDMVSSPNPADSYLTLSWNSSFRVGKLIMHDLLGNKILEKSIEGSAKEAKLNTSGYPDGLYFCILESEGELRAVKKIIIRH
jgi:hypothetical protein